MLVLMFLVIVIHFYGLVSNARAYAELLLCIRTHHRQTPSECEPVTSLCTIALKKHFFMKIRCFLVTGSSW